MSKTKKDRSGKLKAFKQKHKPKKPNIKMEKQIVRKATWPSEERFTVTGDEYEALTKFANFVAPLVEMSNRILGQAELDEKLGFEYAYIDGTEVPAEIVAQYESERLSKLSKRREEIEKYMKLLHEQNEKIKEEMTKIKPDPSDEVQPPEAESSN